MYGTAKLAPEDIEREVRRLLMDDDVTNPKGIAPFVLTGEERWLSIRAFTDSQKLAAFTYQPRPPVSCACPGEAWMIGLRVRSGRG